jgi:MHS family proline/betaine transporter-like MFS transporter
MRNVYAGNFIDFLEFSLFSALLPFITKDVMGQCDPHSKAVFGYLILYLGFLTRPLGAYYLGKIGDLYSRKKLLFISILGISVSTLLFSIIPENLWYVGYVVAILRLLQGIFTGAEHAAATVYSFENEKNMSAGIAKLTASGIFGAATAQLLALACTQFDFISWRLCFFLVALLGLFISMVRLAKTPDTYQNKKKIIENQSLYPYLDKIILGALMAGLANGLFYLITAYLNISSMIMAGTLIESAFIVNFISTTFLGLAVLAWSCKSREIQLNPYKYIGYALTGICILIYPVFYASIEWGAGLMSMLIQISFVLVMQLFTFSSLYLVPTFFPESIRVRGSGFSIHLGNSLFGGAAPLISVNLVSLMGSLYAPVLYFVCLIVVLTSIIFNIKNKEAKSLVCEAI